MNTERELERQKKREREKRKREGERELENLYTIRLYLEGVVFLENLASLPVCRFHNLISLRE